MQQNPPAYMTTVKERISFWSYFIGQNAYYHLSDKDMQIMAKCNSGEITREEAEARLSRKY